MTTISFLVAIGFGLIIPAIPIFARTFGVSNTLIGLIISSFAIVRFLTGLFSGKLVDLYGERLVLGIGLLMVSIFTLFAGLAQSYEQLLLFRTAGGLGSSMFSVSAGSMILRVVNDNQRGQAQSLYNGGFIAGGVAGPAFGGALLAISPRAPFFIYTGLLIIAGTVSLIFLHEKRLGGAKAEVADSSPALTIREALKIKPYLYSLFLAFLGSWVFFGMRSSILPLFVIDELGATTTVIGLSFTLALITQGAVMYRAGKYADQNGRRPVIITGFTITLLALVLLVVSTNVAFYIAAMMVLGIGAGFAASASAIIGDVIKGRSGKVYAIWQMSGDAGMMIGPILLGVIADLFSYRSAILISALIFSVTIFIAIKIPETNSARLGDSINPELRED